MISQCRNGPQRTVSQVLTAKHLGGL